MIVLDTNVISELMRTDPHPAVFAWAVALFGKDLGGRILAFDADVAAGRD